MCFVLCIGKKAIIESITAGKNNQRIRQEKPGAKQDKEELNKSVWMTRQTKKAGGMRVGGIFRTNQYNQFDMSSKTMGTL